MKRKKGGSQTKKGMKNERRGLCKQERHLDRRSALHVVSHFPANSLPVTRGQSAVRPVSTLSLWRYLPLSDDCQNIMSNYHIILLKYYHPN